MTQRLFFDRVGVPSKKDALLLQRPLVEGIARTEISQAINGLKTRARWGAFQTELMVLGRFLEKVPDAQLDLFASAVAITGISLQGTEAQSVQEPYAFLDALRVGTLTHSLEFASALPILIFLARNVPDYPIVRSRDECTDALRSLFKRPQETFVDLARMGVLKVKGKEVGLSAHTPLGIHLFAWSRAAREDGHLNDLVLHHTYPHGVFGIFGR